MASFVHLIMTSPEGAEPISVQLCILMMRNQAPPTTQSESVMRDEILPIEY